MLVTFQVKLLLILLGESDNNMIDRIAKSVIQNVEYDTYEKYFKSTLPDPALFVQKEVRLKDYRIWKEMDNRALAILQQNVSETLLNEIIEAKSAYLAWNMLRAKTETTKIICDLSAQIEYEGIRQKESETLADYLRRAMLTKEKYERARGEPIEERDFCLKIAAHIHT